MVCAEGKHQVNFKNCLPGQSLYYYFSAVKFYMLMLTIIFQYIELIQLLFMTQLL